MENRERLGSRLGFIMLSAGCAIGCGNVWKFPWMCGQNGGGSFMLIYLLCLVILGIPALVLEFSIGRAAQTSPLFMYRKLEEPGQKWGIFGWFCLLGNIALMAFYTVVTGWIIYYFIKFLTGQNADFGFTQMIANPTVNVVFLLVTVVVAFAILSFNLQGGLERITKYMMLALLVLMLVLAVHSLPLPGAAEGLKFYLVPDFGKIDGSVVVGAMNQAFFTLSLGVGAMEIFGSYMSRDYTLAGESLRICALDTCVAICSGLIIFPACFSYGVSPDAGPKLIFITLPNVFANMTGGRLWGTLFFVFMTFASFSTIIAVFQNILACLQESFGWSLKRACAVGTVFILLASVPCILGFNLWSGVQPMGPGSTVLDAEDFLVSNLLLPIGSLIYLLFCVTRWGWGFDNYLTEANTGKGLRLPRWFKPYFSVVLPLLIVFILVQGL